MIKRPKIIAYTLLGLFWVFHSHAMDQAPCEISNILATMDDPSRTAAFSEQEKSFSMSSVPQIIDVSRTLRPYELTRELLDDLTALLRSSPYWKDGQNKNFYDCRIFSKVAYLFLSYQTDNNVYRHLVWNLTGETQGKWIECDIKDLVFSPKIEKFICHKNAPVGIVDFWNKGLFVLEVENDQYLAYDDILGAVILTKNEWANRLLSGLREEINESKYWKPRFRLDFGGSFYLRILELDSWLKIQSIVISDDWSPL